MMIALQESESYGKNPIGVTLFIHWQEKVFIFFYFLFLSIRLQNAIYAWYTRKKIKQGFFWK
jgi:hypothetical protein